MIYFLDFEASSLTTDSYPIEVSWMREDGQGEAHLILPAAGWTDWSFASEYLHGLSRETLTVDGEPVAAVARRLLTAAWAADSLYCDASLDQRWLGTLLGAAGETIVPTLLDVGGLYRIECAPLFDALPEPHSRRYDVAHRMAVRQAADLVADAREAERAMGRPRHRALPDAMGLRWTWLEVRRRVAEHFGGR